MLLLRAQQYPSPSAVWWSGPSEGICRSSLTALNNLCASSLDRETPSATDSLLLLKTHLCVMEQDPDGTWVHSERTWTEQPEGRTSDKRSARTPEAESRLSASRWFPYGGHSSTSVFPCNSLSLFSACFQSAVKVAPQLYSPQLSACSGRKIR